MKIGNDSAASGVKQVFLINAQEELICARLESEINYDEYENENEGEGVDEGEGEDDSDSGIKTNDDDFYNSCGDRLTGITFIKAPVT